MFGWAHHTYPVPLAEWVRDFAYVVSMTELFILGKIIWDWRGSLSCCQKFRHRRPYRFLFAADIWVFINLVLALIISVPALNLFIHGTHVIVAHTMGATIGINTMILLASVFFVIEQRAAEEAGNRHAGLVDTGFWLANGSLAVFLAALLAAGLVKATYGGEFFTDMMESIEPFLLLFAVSGVGLMLGLWLVLLPAMGRIGALVFLRRPDMAIGETQAGQQAAGD
jgi:nitric oxide reductase subunit B